MRHFKSELNVNKQGSIFRADKKEEDQAPSEEENKSQGIKFVSEIGTRKEHKEKDSFDSHPANQLLNRSVLEANQIDNSDESMMSSR